MKRMKICSCSYNSNTTWHAHWSMLYCRSSGVSAVSVWQRQCRGGRSSVACHGSSHARIRPHGNHQQDARIRSQHRPRENHSRWELGQSKGACRLPVVNFDCNVIFNYAYRMLCDAISGLFIVYGNNILKDCRAVLPWLCTVVVKKPMSSSTSCWTTRLDSDDVYEIESDILANSFFILSHTH